MPNRSSNHNIVNLQNPYIEFAVVSVSSTAKKQTNETTTYSTSLIYLFVASKLFFEIY